MSKNEWIKDLITFIIKKRTIFFLVFILLMILAIRSDFSCGWKQGNFDFHFEVTNLNNKLPGR